MSSNGRNATATGQQDWEEGRFGEAFVFTGNDHLTASGNYKGIVGTAAKNPVDVDQEYDKNW